MMVPLWVFLVAVIPLIAALGVVTVQRDRARSRWCRGVLLDDMWDDFDEAPR